MRLNIISWNIRHLRWEKAQQYLKEILTQVDAGHIRERVGRVLEVVLDRSQVEVRKDQAFTLALTAQHAYDKELEDVGLKALRASSND